jgi:hypothetical protein
MHAGVTNHDLEYGALGSKSALHARGAMCSLGSMDMHFLQLGNGFTQVAYFGPTTTELFTTSERHMYLPNVISLFR